MWQHVSEQHFADCIAVGLLLMRANILLSTHVLKLYQHNGIVSFSLHPQSRDWRMCETTASVERHCVASLKQTRYIQFILTRIYLSRY